MNKTCQGIGYETFVYTKYINYCEDIDGNIHFVDWGYNSPWSGWVKEISVGDVSLI